MDYRLSERMMVSACAAGILIVMLGNRRQSLSMSAVGAGLMVLGLLQALVFYKCRTAKSVSRSAPGDRASARTAARSWKIPNRRSRRRQSRWKLLPKGQRKKTNNE